MMGTCDLSRAIRASARASSVSLEECPKPAQIRYMVALES